MNRHTFMKILFFQLVTISFLFSCAASPPVTIVKEKYTTKYRRKHNIDTPAFWKGKSGEYWLFGTAKDTHEIRMYDARTGVYLKTIGKAGKGEGKFNIPNGIAVIDNLLLVTEILNHRVQVFELPSFRSLGFIGKSKLQKPYGLAVYKRRNKYRLYVTDFYRTRSGKTPPPKKLGKRVREYEFYIKAGKLKSKLVNSFGATKGKGVLWKVESIAIDRVYDRLLISDEEKEDIKIYSLDGKFTGKILGKGLYKKDPEGIALYVCPKDQGFWFTTDQIKLGKTIFHIWDRKKLKLLASFSGEVTKNTDGVWLTQTPFPGFPKGAFFAVHDDGAISAFDLTDVFKALKLDCPN
ncbi:phytase precursor [Bdellovibrionota bacterium]